MLFNSWEKGFYQASHPIAGGFTTSRNFYFLSDVALVSAIALRYTECLHFFCGNRPSAWHESAMSRPSNRPLGLAFRPVCNFGVKKHLFSFRNKVQKISLPAAARIYTDKAKCSAMRTASGFLLLYPPLLISNPLNCPYFHPVPPRASEEPHAAASCRKRFRASATFPFRC